MKKKTLHFLVVVLFIWVLLSLTMNTLLMRELKTVRGEVHSIQLERENALERVLETKQELETVIEEK